MSKSPTLRRIQADIRELALDPSDRYHAAPLECSMLEWHFTICGADDTDFAGGIYHGRILLPPEYPFKPPHIIFLTPTGRFETHTKICLSFSAFHPELWQPAWGIRLILEALISFLPTPADGALGALDWSAAERQKLAAQSVTFVCPTCQCCVKDLIPKKRAVCTEVKPKSRFQKEIEELQRLQFLEHPKTDETKDATSKTITATTTASTSGADASGTTPSTTVASLDATVSTGSTAPTAAAVASVAAPANANVFAVDVSRDLERPVAPSETAPPPPRPVGTTLVRTEPEETPLLAAPAPPLVAAPAPPPNVMSSVVDPLLHAIIIVLAILVYLWLRKVLALIHDIQTFLD